MVSILVKRLKRIDKQTQEILSVIWGKDNEVHPP